MHVVVFGANGPTGRLLVDQATDAGYKVSAVTRRPQEYPSRDGLTVVGADVLNADAVVRAVDGADAVLSTLGVPYSRRPITVYSTGLTNIVAGMKRHGIQRLAVVSSAAVVPNGYPGGGLLFDRVLQPLVFNVFGKTLYDDMRRMEAIVRSSGLDWTILRPSGLFTTQKVSDYRLAEGPSTSMFTSRADLADSLFRQVADGTHVGKAVSVSTTEGAPSLLQLFWREALKR